MAALERPVPSPEAFLGQPWAAWVREAALPHTHCAAPSHSVELEETGKEGGKSREVMRLNKEDMHLFGHYPAHDDFYLVVCNICNQVVKPQVFQSHCERRHGSMCKPSPSPTSPPCNSRASYIQMKPKSCISGHNSVSNNSKPFKTPKDNLITSTSKQHMVFSSKVSRDKPCVPVPVVSLEKIPNLVKAEGANVKMNSTTATTITTTSASSSTISATIKSALTSKSVPPSPEKILNGKGVIAPSIDKKHQNGTKNSNKSYKRVSEREFDPNKHCGVLDPETKKPCARSLTCKTHSLNHRRAVPGRKKQFDILLAEHKARSREKEVAKDKEHPQCLRETHQTQSGPVQDTLLGASVNSGQEPKGTSLAKSRLPNSVFPRPPSTNSINSTSSSNHGGYAQELPLPSMGGDLPSRLSSDEGEVDGCEESEKLDCHYSGHHPRPLGFCSFGSHLMGRGYYVFDRRWDRFRLALNSMVEKHLNSQMWKKIPPAVDSPMPSPAAHITTPFPASVLQPFSNPSAVYIPSTPVSSRIPSSYIMTSAMLSNATFVSTADTNSIISHTTAFPHVAASLSIIDSTFKTPSAMSPVPAVIPSPSHKPSKTKTSKSSKVRDLSCRSDDSSSNKKKRPPSSSSSLSLQTSSSSSSFSGSHKKNCVLNPSSPLNSYQATSSYNSMSVHNANNGTTPLSAKSEPSGRTSLSSSSTDSVKHMSIVVSSIDTSSLSIPSLVHHSGDHSLAAHNAVSSLPLCFDKSEGKKRKNSSSSSKACKITKMPGMNSVHKKSTANLISTVPDTPNSSISRQIGKNSSVALSQSSPSSTSNPVHNKQVTLYLAFAHEDHGHTGA
ncbi:ataxin-7-like protein 1 isoform X6 [Rhineura floridana]|uniref:ataxin-7-like protein 1 isoform X6 n=1 Tax=Rhineura floridana TaxID=261503 RepID=UPI002AC817AC|nr:ataxin-7-like protein 1 isoform X6 [Rhineura floridana]